MFVALALAVATVNLISSPIAAEAARAPKRPVFQLIDAKGVLIGIVITNTDTNTPYIYDDTVKVYFGGRQLEYNLSEPISGNGTYFKGTKCEEPWFSFGPAGDTKMLNKKWYETDGAFEITNEDLKAGEFSYQDRQIFSDGSRSDMCIDSTNGGFSVAELPRTAMHLKEIKVIPDPANLTWPLRIVSDKEVNGPLFYGVTFGEYEYWIVKSRGVSTKYAPGAFYFSASEPYLSFDIVARNSKKKIIKTWRNQKTGFWGNGVVPMVNESVKSISKYKFSLIYKGKVVATLP